MTTPEFLAWTQTQETGRYELFRGEIVATEPERAGLAKAKASIWRALDAAIRRVDAQTLYQPAALVKHGERIRADALLAPAPIVIVEVLSPSSRNIDKSMKLADCFTLPSLAHYLVVDADRHNILHYRRVDEEPITPRIVRDSTIRLDPPGVDIATSDIFA